MYFLKVIYQRLINDFTETDSKKEENMQQKCSSKLLAAGAIANNLQLCMRIDQVWDNVC